MSVGVAQNAVKGRLGSMSEVGAHGRSFHRGARDTRADAVRYGLNVTEQWERALQEDEEADDTETRIEGHGRWRPLLGFESVPVSSADEVVVPKGYTAEVLIAWGDPVSSGPAFKQDASNTAADQARQWGMHNDGLVYFPIVGSQRGLIVQNNEYTDDGLLFPDGVNNWTQEKTNKSLNAHGVSIIEVTKGTGFPWDWKRRRGKWDVVRPSPFARRISGMTAIEIGGPAAGDARFITSEDPTGRRVLGTLNNCTMGFTPWGTYLDAAPAARPDSGRRGR